MSLWGRWDTFKQTAKNIQTGESHAWSAEGVIQAVFPEGRNSSLRAGCTRPPHTTPNDERCGV